MSDPQPDAADTAPTPVRNRRRLLVRAAAIVGGIFVAWSAFGFLVAPTLLRNVLVKQASAALKRDASVAKVRVNPLALSVTIEGFAVKHRNGSPFLGWDSLYVRLSPWRMLRGDLGLAEIRLVRPAVAAGLDRAGALTFQDLLEPDASQPATPSTAPAPEAKGDGIGISIGRLAIEEAQVSFTDETRRPAFASTLGPLTVRLESFRTKGGGDSPYTFAGTTDAGETFRWTGTVRTQPLRSAGTLAFERIALPRYTPYAQDEYPIVIREGLLDYETAYELEWGTDRRAIKISKGRMAIDGLAVGPRGGDADVPVKLPRMEMTGIDADLLAKDARVAEFTVRGGTLRVRKEAAGLELMRMMPPPSEGKWSWAVGAVQISGATMQVEDRTPPRPVLLPLTDVQVRLEQLKKGTGSVSPLSMSLTWNGRGRLAVKGPIQPLGDKGKLEIDAKDLDLTPFDPYLEPGLKARLTGGRAGAKATVSYDMTRPATRWTFQGDVRLDGLAVAEAGNEELLRWRALELTGIDAASTPPRASVRLVRLVEPRAKVYVWEDGATSIARVLGQKPEPAKVAAAGAAPEGEAKPEDAPPVDAPKPAPKPAAKSAGPEWRTAIGAVQLLRGRASFLDRSVTPTAVVNVTSADVRVTSLSSDPKVRSTLDVKLELEGASPIRIAGTLNPLRTEADSDVTIASKGVDLTPLGPYAGKYLGYGIQKGKLDLDLRYKVENRVLAGANLVTMNQFTLGEATQSPDATHLPVRLAIALLQDPNGVILLDVPVEGNLDDPEFRIGRVVLHTLVNIVKKLVTSPFSALAALAGGGKEDLSLVEFTPGTSDLLPEASQRFGLLAKSLGQRPSLGLELEGAAGPEADGPALRRAAFERSLKRAKAATMRPALASDDEVTLSSDDRARLVRAAHDAAFPGAGRKPGEPPPTQLDMEERLVTAQEVPADAYRSLAAERAQRARDALLAAGIDAARLFLAQGGERAQKEKGSRVYFTVR
jgi:hypothetical protein